MYQQHVSSFANLTANDKIATVHQTFSSDVELAELAESSEIKLSNFFSLQDFISTAKLN